MKYANLHLHSHFSDGVHSPAELCRRAKETGYRALAITDHENTASWKELPELARAAGLDYILGFEAYARGLGTSFHITCYDFDRDDKDVVRYFNTLNEIAYLKTKAKFDALSASGYLGSITWQDVLDDSAPDCWLCNENIFASMIKRLGKTQKDYWDYSREFHSHKIKPELPFIDLSAEKLIPMIKKAGGFCVVAHPHGQAKYLPALYDLGLAGAEYDHPDIYPEDIQGVLDFAKEHKFYLSGGSDHTGYLGNEPFIRGDYPGPRSGIPYDSYVYNGVTEEEFYLMKNRIYG